MSRFFGLFVAVCCVSAAPIAFGSQVLAASSGAEAGVESVAANGRAKRHYAGYRDEEELKVKAAVPVPSRALDAPIKSATAEADEEESSDHD